MSLFLLIGFDEGSKIYNFQMLRMKIKLFFPEAFSISSLIYGKWLGMLKVVQIDIIWYNSNNDINFIIDTPVIESKNYLLHCMFDILKIIKNIYIFGISIKFHNN